MEYPVSRKLVKVNDSEGKGVEIKIMSYNLLAQTGLRRDQFPYTSANCLKWTYRKNILLKEVTEAKSDIYCFQECDSKYYKEFWLPHMDKLGYKSQFKPKTVKVPDQSFGIAIFYKTSIFEEQKYEALEFDDTAKGLTGVHLEEMSRTNVGQVMVLKLKGEENEKRGIILGNVHLFWHPKYDWVRLKQVEMLMDKLVETQKNFPYSIFAVGDFNSTPNTRIYKFITTTTINEDQFPKFFLPEDHSDPNVSNVNMVAQADLDGTLMSKVSQRAHDPERVEAIKAIIQKGQSNYPKFTSAYGKYTDLVESVVSKYWVGEPAFTSYTQWKGTLDYIFFSSLKKEDKDCVVLKSIVEIPAEEVLAKQKGLPSDEFGSDHVSIMAIFELL